MVILFNKRLATNPRVIGQRVQCGGEAEFAKAVAVIVRGRPAFRLDPPAALSQYVVGRLRSPRPLRLRGCRAGGGDVVADAGR